MGAMVEERDDVLERARRIAGAFAALEAPPGTRMVTPAVIEIIAVRGAAPPVRA